MKIFDNIMKNLGLAEEELISYKAVDSLPVTMQKNTNTGRKNLITTKPKNFADIEKVVDGLKSGECSIIDLGAVKYKDMIRIIDFLSGSIYALQGELKRLQGDLYLLIPNNIKLNNLE